MLAKFKVTLLFEAELRAEIYEMLANLSEYEDKYSVESIIKLDTEQTKLK